MKNITDWVQATVITTFLLSCSSQSFAGECSMNAQDFNQLNADITQLLTSKTDAMRKDSDGDGLSDWDEIQLGTNPNRKDSDGDGIDDQWELNQGLNPLYAADANFDADRDGFSNLAEYRAKTNPRDKESNPNRKVAMMLAPIIEYVLD